MAGVAVETVYAAFRKSPPCCAMSGTSASAAMRKTFVSWDRPEIPRARRAGPPRDPLGRHAVVRHRGVPSHHTSPGQPCRAPPPANPQPPRCSPSGTIRRLDACSRRTLEAAAASGQLAVSEAECRQVLGRNHGRLAVAAARRRVAGGADERFAVLARSVVDLGLGHAPLASLSAASIPLARPLRHPAVRMPAGCPGNVRVQHDRAGESLPGPVGRYRRRRVRGARRPGEHGLPHRARPLTPDPAEVVAYYATVPGILAYAGLLGLGAYVVFAAALWALLPGDARARPAAVVLLAGGVGGAAARRGRDSACAAG